MKKEKSIPSILGVTLLIVCLAVGVYLSARKTYFSPQASSDCRPDNLQITNITQRSASVSFITSSPCLSTLNLNNLTFRNTISSTTSQVHYFEIPNLESQKNYTFSLIIGEKTYTNSQYNFTTATTPTTPIPSSNLAWGKVFTSTHQLADNTIVYLNIPGASPLSSFTTADGNWNISLANSFNDSKTDWFTSPASPVSEDIVVIAADGSTTQISHTTARNNPVPDIIIGQNSLGSGSISTEPVGALPTSGPIVNSSSINFTLTNPLEGDTLNTLKPQFFGSATPNSTVNVEIHSNTVTSGQSTSNQTGQWLWTPPQNLSPGKYTVTVKNYNQTTGVWDTISRQFTVLAAAAGPAFTASQSAAISSPPTVLPSPSPSSVPPTNTPVPRSAVISTSSGTPVTGDVLPTQFLITFALIFIVGSIYLFKKI
jgi:hypothetical protein